MAAGGPQARKIQKVVDSWKGFKAIDLDILFKRINYKIDVKKLFKRKDYEELERYEKRRIRKIGKHLTVMWWLGEFKYLYNFYNIIFTSLYMSIIQIVFFTAVSTLGSLLCILRP